LFSSRVQIEDIKEIVMDSWKINRFTPAPEDEADKTKTVTNITFSFDDGTEYTADIGSVPESKEDALAFIWEHHRIFKSRTKESEDTAISGMVGLTSSSVEE
jgi:hypothetical protein